MLQNVAAGRQATKTRVEKVKQQQLLVNHPKSNETASKVLN